jgi:hypothetical protein
MKESNKGVNTDRFWKNGRIILTCPKKDLVYKCPFCGIQCNSLTKDERKTVANRANIFSPHHQNRRSKNSHNS